MHILCGWQLREVTARSWCRIFAAPMKEQHLAMKSLKETMQARSTALGHRLQAEAAVKAVRTRLAQLRSSGKPEAVLQVRARAMHAAVARGCTPKQLRGGGGQLRNGSGCVIGHA